MSFTNYHGHCHYCDGKEAPEAYVLEAIRQQMPAYGFSSHAPLPYEIAWTMQEKRAQEYVREIHALKQQYAGQIDLFTGMEVDYIPGIAGPGQARIRDLALDYTIGSVHFVDFFDNGHPWEIDGTHQLFLQGLEHIFQGDIEQAIRRYFALIRQLLLKDPPDVLGHLDKIKIQNEDGALFSEDASWYREEVMQTLEVLAKTSVIAEVNTRGLYKKKSPEPYPSFWILEQMKQLDIPVMLNSDAHHPAEVTACFELVSEHLLQIGYEHVHVLTPQGWQQVPLTRNGVAYKTVS